ncbi:JAB-like toxin 1 domain-containing protein [Sinomicrobium sp. M5D2P17]
MEINVRSIEDALDWSEDLSGMGHNGELSFIINVGQDSPSLLDDKPFTDNEMIPQNLIDPPDTYRMDAMGRIRHADNKTHYDKSGEVVHKLISDKTGKSILVKQSILENMTKCTFVANKEEVRSGKREKIKNLTLLTIEDEGAALAFFKFMADNGDVEQALQAFSDSSGSETFYIYSNYDLGSVQMDTDFFDMIDGFSPWYKIHSHPFDDNDPWDEFPSGYGPTGISGDRGYRERFIRNYGYQKHYMYHNGEHSLTEYSNDRHGFVKKNNITLIKLKTLNLRKGFGAK